jgi:hypothetical protein
MARPVPLKVREYDLVHWKLVCFADAVARGIHAKSESMRGQQHLSSTRQAIAPASPMPR